MGFLRTFVFIMLLVALAAGGVAFEARAWVASDTAPASLLPLETSASVAAPSPRVPASAMATSGVSMDQAVKMAEQRYKARVVRAEAQHDGPRTVYVLKLLNDAGHVWTVRVDAANGAIL
jgi:hypothetical protein